MIRYPVSSPRSSGFGGMLVIATFGLAVLVFGGILTNSRAIAATRASIDDLRFALERHALLKPMAERIGTVEQAIRSELPRATPARSLTAPEIPAFRERLLDLARTANLEARTITHSLDSTDPLDFRIRFDLRLRGDYPKLRTLLEQLDSLPVQVRVEGLSISALPTGQDLQLLFVASMQ